MLKSFFVKIFALLCCFLIQSQISWGLPHTGHILFLAQQGHHEHALKLYQTSVQVSKKHDFDTLHQIALRILEDGFRRSDPESQLLALFGASISTHEDAYYILEESLKSCYLQIQLVALNALARFQNDRADQALLRALGSPALEVRYEALYQLCKKKHPQAASQAESLMYKSPPLLWKMYPPLLAMAGDSHAIKILCKLLNHSSSDLRLSVIKSLAKYRRDDLLPQIRQQLSYPQYAQQEACAYALGCLKDELAIPKLEKLTFSQYPTVALAAQFALYQLGHTESIQAIERAAQQGDLFAISLLGLMPDHPTVLLQLLENPHLQTRLNALIALLEQHHPQALGRIKEVVIRDKRDLAFIAHHSPGHALKSYKIVFSARALLKDHPHAFREDLEFKEAILEKVRELSEFEFIALAHQIFATQQNDLVPKTVELLEDMGTNAAIECLKEHQQQFGAPLVRHYCHLALYNLQEPGPYGDQLCQWVKMQSQAQFIRFEPFSPWQSGGKGYTLTPEETSQLLIKACEALAREQSIQGIETLIEVIATGHAKNKYALAGLLLRSTQ